MRLVDDQQVIDFEYRYCNQEFYTYTGLVPEIVIGNKVSSSPAISDTETRRKLFDELLAVYEGGHRTQAWIYNPNLKRGPSGQYPGFVTWLARRLMDRHPDYDAMRMRMQKVAIGEPGEPPVDLTSEYEEVRERPAT